VQPTPVQKRTLVGTLVFLLLWNFSALAQGNSGSQVYELPSVHLGDTLGSNHRQTGVVRAYCWTQGPASFSTTCVDNKPAFPKLPNWSLTTNLRIYFSSELPPDNISVTYWHQQRDQSKVEQLTPEVVPSPEESRLEWYADFSPRLLRLQTLTMLVQATWKDQTNCTNCENEASWGFRIRVGT
jgi:hypothetical protein